MKKVLLIPFLLLALAGFSPTQAAAPKEHKPAFDKVMIVIFENTDFQDAFSRPFLGQLAKQGALLTNFFAETHPSQPNYLALVSGSTQAVTSDDNVTIDAKHIGDLLEQHGKTWKVYAEGYPGHCFLGARSGLYVRKHLPFLSFKDVQNNPERCGRIVAASELGDDIKNGALPDYSLYVPDLNDDAHDTNVGYADKWLAKTFGPLIKNQKFMKGMLLVFTFDEDSYKGNNRVYTVLYGDAVRPGVLSKGRYNHYNLLRTIEDAWRLGSLGANDATASPISGVWAK